MAGLKCCCVWGNYPKHGHFIRPFFYSHFQRRDAKVKIKYQFVTGETLEVEASGALGETIVAFDREIYNNNQRETRRHCSFDKLTDAGFQIADAKSEVAAAVEQMDRNVALHEAINALSPKQKRLIQQVFFEEKTITKIALARHFNTPMPPEQWCCSQAHALTLGLPASLEGVAKCLKLPQQKMQEGKQLIRFFSLPCRATKSNGGRTRNLPEHDPGKWELFKTYCKQDVEVERSVRQKLNNYPVPEQEIQLWFLDQRINDYGVRVDMGLVENAIKCDEVYQRTLMKEAKHLTRLDNPNSPAQLKGWLQDKHGIQIESLAKDTVVEILEEVANPIAKRALELRQEMSKTSVKKYEAMDRAVCKDERVRGLLQYYGASTGRFSGRLVQIHNLPRNNMSDLDLARRLLSAGNYEALELLFESVPDVLSQLIRTAFIPSPGHRLIVSDFSAIEARIVAWLAGEKWVIDTFNGQGKIYEMTARKMFREPRNYRKRPPEYELRQKV